MNQEVTSETNNFKHTFDFIEPTKRPRSLPSPPQVRVQFVCHTLHQYFSKLSCNNTQDATLINQFEETSEGTCQFDLRAILNLNKLRSHLSPVLSKFEITEDMDVHKVIVSDIGNVSQRLGRDVIQKGERRGLITFQVTISKTHNMFRCEGCLIQRVTRESIVEAEESETTMVPASESSIKKLMKKRVRVEEGESCSVCLEEFRAGRYETSMDCSHVFHRECIGKWLKMSHYCPVCRYEMPTHDDEN